MAAHLRSHVRFGPFCLLLFLPSLLDPDHLIPTPPLLRLPFLPSNSFPLSFRQQREWRGGSAEWEREPEAAAGGGGSGAAGGVGGVGAVAPRAAGDGPRTLVAADGGRGAGRPTLARTTRGE